MAPAPSIADFERHLEHDRRAERQGRHSEYGPHGHLVRPKYIAKKLRCCVRDDGLVVEVSRSSQIDSNADDLTHTIQGTQMRLRSRKSIQGRGSQSILASISIELLANVT